ncbi:MARTX multifunctional-autoprocessing repeats-in-toxin holotoxin RtxA [Yersinia bercovieri]|uniref:MARTX multifunctional-autoprocessing repeats-in-toxin holotoxin RtxA n=1 Tax=Yersinia bercovieri TaxID=634 RepID=UPI003FD82A60
MSKATNRSTEFFFTGAYNGDNGDNDIDAIGLGGVIYARGGDDNIKVGAIGVKIETGSGNDTVKGGAGYLEIEDTTGNLQVSTLTGGLNINKYRSGDVNVNATGLANIINHSGAIGSINASVIGGYNKITRESASYGANNRLTEKDIILGSASFRNNSVGITTKKNSVIKEKDYYLYECNYEKGGIKYKTISKVRLFTDVSTGDVKAKVTTKTYGIDFDSKSGKKRKLLLDNEPSVDLVDINYKVKTRGIVTNYETDFRKLHVINGVTTVYEKDNPISIPVKNVTLNAIRLDGGRILQAAKSTKIANTYFFYDYDYEYLYEIKLIDGSKVTTEAGVEGKKEPAVRFHITSYYYRYKDKEYMNARRAKEVYFKKLDEIVNSVKLHGFVKTTDNATVPEINGIEYSYPGEVYADEEISRLESGKVSNITGHNSGLLNNNVNFNGGGVANVIESNVGVGDVIFSGGGAGNIITHTAIKGKTVFNGGGIANIIVKGGGEGNLIFDGAGLANVIVHKSKKGDMRVVAGGAVNVMVRIGTGKYDVQLTALGNISIHSGDGDSIVRMLGGFNTHTQIGDGEAFWIAAGGLNVMTRKGQGSIFSVVGGGGNVVTNIGNGDLTIVALGLGNIITHISDNEHNARSIVIAVAGANIVTKKGRGDMQAILAGGLNVLTHVGGGKTDAIMLGGGNILTKVGNGDATGILFGLGNIFTHLGDGQTIGVMIAAGNIYTKVGSGTTIAAMLAVGNIMTHIGNGNGYVLMAALGNVATKIGDGDILALMIAKANILTQVGHGQTIALMLANGANIMTKVGDGMTLAAMVSLANILTHIGDGESFALMIGKANVFTKVGLGLSVAAMIGNANIFSQINIHKNESIGGAVFIGQLNIMTKVGDGTAMAIMLGKANVMTHIGDGITGGLALSKVNIMTKVGNGFMGVLAKAEGNVITHVGTGITAVALYGKGNLLTKVGDDTTIGLLISETGNVMTHVGNGMTIGIAKGKANVITKIGDGLGVNAVWGKVNLITQIGHGERYNFVKGDANILTKVGDGQEVTVVKGEGNIVSVIGDSDNYTAAWGKNNVITSVGNGRNVVLAKANNNVVTKVGDGDAYHALWADSNIVTKVGNGNEITLAKGKTNITTDIGDGLNIAAVYGDTNINTKVGNGISINVSLGKYNVNTKVGDGVNVAVMKGKTNANINIGDGLSVVATYGRNNVSVKVGSGDYYSLAVASSNTQSNKLSALFGSIKQNLLGRAGSQAINYLINGSEGNTSGFTKGHGEINLAEIENLNGFKLNETALEGKYHVGDGGHDFSAASESTTDIEMPDLSDIKSIAERTLGGGDYKQVSTHDHHSEVEKEVINDNERAEKDGEKLKQEKDKYTSDTSLIQAQLDSTDKSALVATGSDYRQQMQLQAGELADEQQKITQGINNIADVNNTDTVTGGIYREQFARNLLQDISETLEESKRSAHENLDKSQSHVSEYKQKMNEAIAKSESALAKGEQSKVKADAAKAVAERDVAKRRSDAEGLHESARDTNKKARKDATAAEQRGENDLKDASSKAAAAAQNAKSVQQSEKDTPANRQNAKGSGLNKNQVAYQTDTNDAFATSSSSDVGPLPESTPILGSDSGSTKKISDDIAVGIEKVNSVHPIIPDKNDSNYFNTNSHTQHKQNWMTRIANRVFFDSKTSGKEDKNYSFHFSQSGDLLNKIKNKLQEIVEEKNTNSDKEYIKRLKGGVCFSLSTKYLMAERNYGPGGGKRYLEWLAEVVDLQKNKNKNKNNDIIRIKNELLMEYNKGFFESEVNDVFNLQSLSNRQININNYELIVKRIMKKSRGTELSLEEIISSVKDGIKKSNGVVDEHFFDKINNKFDGKMYNSVSVFSELLNEIKNQTQKNNFEYGDLLNNNGFSIGDKSFSLADNDIGFEMYIKSLKNSEKNTFSLFMSSNHVMAISVTEKDGKRYWSFFDPNEGGVAFDSYDKFCNFMNKYHKQFYTLNKFIGLDKFTPINKFNPAEDPDQTFIIGYSKFRSNNEMDKVTGIWEESRRGEQEFLLNKMKEENIQFNLDKNTRGKVVDFTTHKGTNEINSITLEVFDKNKKHTHRVKIPGTDIIGVTDKIRPYINKIRKLENQNDLRMITDEKSIRFVSNNSEDLAKDVLTIKLPHLKTLGDDEYNPLKVDKWVRILATEDQTESSIRYHSQVIVQLEDNHIAAEAAANLAAKHPGSVLVQLDADGNYRVISGEPASLQGNIRWQLVGHGRDHNNGQGNQTMANASAAELAERVKSLQDKLDDDHRIKSTPGYISLVGCRLIDKTKQHGFAQQFILELDKQGIRTDVAARNSRIHINEEGRKITLDDDKNARHKASEDKIVLRLNNDGGVENVSERVKNSVHLSEIDINRIGKSDVDLPATGAIGRIVEEYTQPERKTKIATDSPSTVKDQAISYSGNINIQIGDDEFTCINWGTSNLGIKVGHGGFKTLVFGDNNIMIHIGDGMSKHSVNIGGYQAFEGVQVFMGNRNISFNHGFSNDLILMTEKTVLSPPLVNPFDGATRVSVTLESIANEGSDGDWLQVQDQQWTLSGAKQYLNDLSALDGTSSVDYKSLTELDSQLVRSGRGLKSDIEGTLNKKYNQWLGKPAATVNNNQDKLTKVDKLRQLNDTMVFNLAIGGQGADIIVTNSNWNFTFGDNIQSIMDINLGSLFAISTQQFTLSGRVKTTMTYSIDDMPRQIKNQLLGKLSLVDGEMTLGDIFDVDYDASGQIISRTGEPVDAEAILKEMLDVVAEFGGEKLKVLSNPQKLLDGLKANLNMGENAMTSFAQSHGLQDKPPVEAATANTDNAAIPLSGSTAATENKDRAFGFNSLNLPNLFATLFNKDKQTEMADMVDNLKENMAKDLLNMEEKTFDFLRSSGFLRGDGDLNWSLGNYNFTLGGHGNDLGAYLGDNNNFWGGDGEDAFYGMGISNIFTGGKGDDIGVLMGRENTMFGGEGDDTAVIAGRINHADLGRGNDKAFVFGEAGIVKTGVGQDYVVIAGNYNETDSGQDQDYVVTIGNNNVTELGEGDDFGRVFGNENIVSGKAGNDSIKLLGYHCVIEGDEGNDRLIADVISKFSQLDGGVGDDVLVLGGYQNSFSGGDGVDKFVVSTSVIDCTVTDITYEDNILFNSVSWQDLWLQRSGYDLTILVRRPVNNDSAQGDFERVGSVTFNDYFNGKRAAFVIGDKGKNGEGYQVLSDSVIDDLIQSMNTFPVSNGESSFTEGMDTQLQQQIARLWGSTTQQVA